MPSIKSQFLLDPSIHFLNHGSFGATPKPVFDEYQCRQLELEKQPVEFLGRRFNALLAESRKALGEYLETSADNLVYTNNVTVSLNMVARSLDLKEGDEVLSSDHEYGAVDRMWRFLSREKGFTYINQPADLTSHESFIESFWRGVTPKTKAICVSHITSPTAILFPIEEIVRRARANNIIMIVDGAHAPGQIPLDIDSLGADFYCGNLHKWLCAPKGAGFLQARPEAQNLLKPFVVSWGYEPIAPGVSAFIDQNEWIGTRDIAAFLAVPAAIEFQKEHHWDEIRAGCHQLALDAQTGICDLFGIPPLHSTTETWFAQMATAPLPADSDLPALKSRLYDEYRIEVPLIEWNGHKLIRVSFQAYNDKNDLGALLAALKELFV